MDARLTGPRINCVVSGCSRVTIKSGPTYQDMEATRVPCDRQADRAAVAQSRDGTARGYEERRNSAICDNMGGPGGHHAE